MNLDGEEADRALDYAQKVGQKMKIYPGPRTGQSALYATDDGTPITTQSMIKTFRNCPREAFYKYHLRLKPKTRSVPLTRGKWIHAILEHYYRALEEEAGHPAALDAAYREHKAWCSRYGKLFDEEKEELGDLPREIWALIQSYFWYYKASEWKIHNTELTLEAKLPNGHLFRGRVDLIIEDQFGIWIVDHKSHKKLPDWQFRMLDEQSPLYVWAANEMGIPARGFIWNYLCTTAPSTPRVVLAGDRFYKKCGETDYPTLLAACRDAGFVRGGKWTDKVSEDERERLTGELRRLKAIRWSSDMSPASPFFRRDILERSEEQVERVVQAVTVTSEKMHNYDFSQPDLVERNTMACKGWLCNYKSLNIADFMAGGVDQATVQREYSEHDPMEYYDGEEPL